jgi:eukaryotic-like serine/threonine-protein kinase
MALAPGLRLGPYEVAALLGEGGMGEVYKAKDTRLDRTVAVKVLPEHVAADPELKHQFEREAKTLAALSHPHICPVFDAGNQDGIDFLVMEYLEGETLEQRLKKGGLPLDQALQIGIQIANALAAAHRAGIVHRDLKPGNIMLTRSAAKLLDFGLAKTGAPAVAGSLSVLPTTPPNLTAQGAILGTFQYMAPEQLEGQDADERTDIFAFGAVLYEMVTGKRAFEGKSQASLIAAILERDPPPVSTLQSLVPPALDRIVAKCLAKDPDARWQSARDLCDELEWVESSTSVRDTRVQVDQAAKQKRSTRERLAWAAAAISFVAAAALLVPAIRYLRLPAPDAAITRFEIETPPTLDPMSFALSPDSRQLVFVATSDNVSRLWLRPLEEVKAQPLSGTEDASYPFWSPDSRAIGFFAGGKLKRIDLAAGVPQVLADAPNGRGGTWNRDGVIVFAPNTTGALMRVSATGGLATPVTRLVAGQSSHRWPQFLPDGQHFLFLMTLGPTETRGTYVATLGGDEPRRLLTDDMAAVFAPPGWLLLVNQDRLVVRRFDVARGIVEGEPMALAQGVGDNGILRGSFSVADGGVLAHRAGGGQRRQFVWSDRAGKIVGTPTPVDSNSSQSSVELSPDSRRLALYRTIQGNTDIWLVDLSRGVFTRFTFDSSSEVNPVWSSDGSRVVFRSTRSLANDLIEKPSTGSGAERQFLTSNEVRVPLDSSPDGQFLLYDALNPKTGPDLMALPLTGDGKPFPVVQTNFEEAAGQFSPDGRFLAYESNESGRFEIYVRGFPQLAGPWQVSTEGGTQVRWRRDGKELFYVAPDGRLMAVPVKVAANNELEPGRPVALFMTRLARGANAATTGGTQRAQYAVAADGRFLMNVSIDEAAGSPITIVVNWDAALDE